MHSLEVIRAMNRDEDMCWCGQKYLYCAAYNTEICINGHPIGPRAIPDRKLEWHKPKPDEK